MFDYVFDASGELWISFHCNCVTCRNETHEVIKYLEFCVHCLHNEDPGVHNLLLSLYAKQVGFVLIILTGGNVFKLVISYFVWHAPYHSKILI